MRPLTCPGPWHPLQEQYINDPKVLLDAAEAAGLPRDRAQEVLQDPSAYRSEVESEMRKYGPVVSGVPHFIINGCAHAALKHVCVPSNRCTTSS